MQKNRKNKQNKMINTEMRPSECIKADVLRRRILWQINIIERQISDCKKKFTCFYTQTQKKSHVSAGEKNKNSVSWVEAFDDFAENWEEMESVKNEVDWMLRDIFFVVERVEEEQRKNTKRNIVGVMSMVK